jgi:NADH-quinone oxidoreductase subunit N
MLASMKISLKYLINWASFAKQNMWFAIIFSVILFSMAGVPPLAGFYSKLCVLLSLLAKRYIVTATIVAIFSSIACFYYIRLVKVFFFTSNFNINFWFVERSKSTEAFLSFSISFLFLFLLRPALLTDLCEIAAVSVI